MLILVSANHRDPWNAPELEADSSLFYVMQPNHGEDICLRSSCGWIAVGYHRWQVDDFWDMVHMNFYHGTLLEWSMTNEWGFKSVNN